MDTKTIRLKNNKGPNEYLVEKIVKYFIFVDMPTKTFCIYGEKSAKSY